jgi:GTPase SAR1 family protein
VSNFYKGSHAAIIVFDITNLITFHGVEHWIQDINSYAPDKCPKLLLGNKSDLSNARQVSPEEAQRLADDLGMMYFEVSSKNDDAEVLEEIFRGLAGQVVEKRNAGSVKISAHSPKSSSSSSSSCCS